MIRVLYIVDEAYPTTSANGRIVYRIIDELLTHPDLQISILCRARTHEQLAIKDYKGCPIIHEHNLHASKSEKLNQRLGKYKFMRYVLNPRTNYYRLTNESNYYDAEAKLWIRKHLNDFDVIVANSMPFEPLKIASVFGKKKPVIYYKMEPVAHYLHPEDFERGKQQEEEWDNQASAIVMTNLIYKYYQQYAKPENIKKVVVAQFPCVIDRGEQKSVLKESENKECNIVYVGKFYRDTRNPKYLFSLVDALGKRGMHLTIAGGYQYAQLPEDMIEKYFTNTHPYITYHGELPAEKADELLREADILVHQGNKVPDMMPSKILDYISSGKPILNIYSIDDCPTLPYMEKYDMCMNIKEGEELTDELLDKIYRFCHENKGKRIPFAEIKEKFMDCTPEYVGQQFYDTIKKIIK